MVGRLNTGRQPRNTGSGNHHVRFQRLVLRLRFYHRHFLQDIHISARLAYRVLHRSLDGRAGDSSSGNQIHAQRLRRHNLTRQYLNRCGGKAIADAIGLRMLLHHNIRDGGITEGHIHLHRPLHTGPLAGVRPRCVGHPGTGSRCLLHRSPFRGLRRFGCLRRRRLRLTGRQ